MVTNRPGVRNVILSSVCFAGLLSAAPPAEALVLTYSSNQGTLDKSEATGNPNQARPLQLPRTGGANQGSARNFIFEGLNTNDSAGPGLSAPIWTPVNQYGPAFNNPVSAPLEPGNQRFDYTFDAADDTSGAPDSYKWNNTFKLINFGTFYLDGTCSFCGADKPVSILETLPAYSGSALYEANGQADAQFPPGTAFYLTGSFYNSNVFNIRFGSTDITGTLRFNANSATTYEYANAGGQQSSWGQIVLNIDESGAVPIDLPSTSVLLAAGLAGIGVQRRRRMPR